MTLTRKQIRALISLAAFAVVALFRAWQGAPAQVPAQATPAPAAAQTVPAAPTATVPVSRVVDGDTIAVDIAGMQEKIRIIGINTPETVDPRRPVECFGKEASAHAKELLTGTQVRLEADPTQGDRDKNGRLLRYVFMQDGADFGLTMVQNGYAYEYTYDTPYAYRTAYRDAQAAARAAGRGLWSAQTCNGLKTPVK